MPVLKTASNGVEFQRDAKKYVINMTNRNKKLHIKNGCYHAKCFYSYYDFDNLADAKNCGVESTLCEICFKENKND